MHLLTLLIPLHIIFSSGMATVFYSTESSNPNDGSLACLHRKMDDNVDSVVAHRTLPCGTELKIINLRNGLSTLATVADRGPYGCREKTAKGTRKIKNCRNYTSMIDLSPMVAKKIKHGGFEPVLFYKTKDAPIKKQKRYERRNT